MAGQSAASRESRPLVSLPSNNLAYVAVLAALVSAAIHLFLAPVVMGFDQTTGILFFLNGFGWIGGVLLFVSRYWRRAFYLIAVGYAVGTIIAFFGLGGQYNVLSIASKIAEAVVALIAGYLYTSDVPA